MSEPTKGEYHIALTDEERKYMEQSSFNYFHYTGQYMRIPPKLYADLKMAGVDMKYMVADASLEQ